jgi:hypothetical protein
MLVTQQCCCLMVGNSYRKKMLNQMFEPDFSVDAGLSISCTTDHAGRAQESACCNLIVVLKRVSRPYRVRHSMLSKIDTTHSTLGDVLAGQDQEERRPALARDAGMGIGLGPGVAATLLYAA